GLAIQNPRSDGGWTARGKWRLSRQEFVQHHAKGKDVSAPVRRLVEKRLRRHIAERAAVHLILHIVRRVIAEEVGQTPRHAKIADLNGTPVVTQHDVLGL